MPEGHTVIQSNLNRLKNWADRGIVKFNKKCNVLHLKRSNPRCWEPSSWKEAWTKRTWESCWMPS